MRRVQSNSAAPAAVAALLLGALVTGAGCGMSLPLEERIAGLRPLAMRVEVDDPAAGEDAPVRAEALPFETVRIVPFIVEPQGPLELQRIADELEPRWLACNLAPIEGIGSCLANAAPLQPSEVPACPMIDFSAIDPDSGELPTFPSPCEIVTGTLAQPEFTVAFDFSYLIGGDVEVTMVGHRPGSGSSDRCYEQLLAGGTGADESCLFIAQRVAIGPDPVLIDLASQLGIPDIEGVGDLPDPLPEADTHPRIESFVVRELDPGGTEVAVHQPRRGEVVQVTAGNQLDLETMAPQGDLQTFPIPTESGFVDERETYDGLWYVSWGTLLSSSSDDPLSLNSWTLERGEQDDEGDVPPGGRATLFYVLRDGRQGVTWWWFHVEVSA